MLRTLITALSMALTLSACGGGGDGGGGGGGAKPAKFSVTVASTSLSVGQGQDAVVEVIIKRDVGFNEPITITLNQPATGITTDTLQLSGSVDRGLLPIRVSADLAVDSVQKLDVIGTGGGASQIATSNLTVTAPQELAPKKIAAALAAGTLDYGASLLYRAYALLGDKRLPDSYLGAGSTEEDNGLFTEIAQRFASLPIGAQTELQPFIVRPADPRSVWNATAAANKAQANNLKKAFAAASAAACPAAAAGSWISKRSAGHPVRVWAQCSGESGHDDDNVALIDKTLVVLDKVYTAMTNVMGQPQLDLEGDDNAIDFYIVDDGSYVNRRTVNFRPNGLGSTYSDFAETPIGKGNSAFVTLPRSLLYTSRFHSTVIHEFFHVLQKAHNDEFGSKEVAGNANARELHWFVEASAAWASAHFDRTEAPWDTGRGAYLDAHRRFAQYFQPSFEALNVSGSPHDYSAYIWPYFVEQETSSTDFMKNIWIALETVSTFEAADNAISNAYSFATNFKHFALRNINTELIPGDPLPIAKRYVNLDKEQFSDDKIEPPYLSGTLVGNQELSQDFELKNLSARYVRLTVAAASPATRQVVVDISGLQPASELDVQALVRTDDGWLAQPIDISPAKVTFCFDKGPTTASVRGSFQEILLVVSNHAVAKGTDISGTLKVQPKSAPCSTVWAGTIKQVIHNDTQFGNTTITTSANVTFEFDEVAAATAQPGEIPFKLRNGTFTYEGRFDSIGRNPPCRGIITGSGALPVAPYEPLVPAGTAAGLRVFPAELRFAGSGASVVTTTTTDNCNDSNVDETRVDPISYVFWLTDYVGVTSADGLSIRSVNTVPNVVSHEISLDLIPLAN